MKWMIRSTKWLLRSVLSLLLVYAILAFILSWWSTDPPERDCPADKLVYVTTTGVHLDIVIPVQYLKPDLRRADYLNNRTRYVAFGWGERNFYLETPTWSDLTVRNAASALLINSETVMHLRSYESARKSWHAVPLCEDDLTKLRDYIATSFVQSKDGRWLPVPAEGYSANDFFYLAHGKYNAINTCNVWVNNALKAAGVKTARWSPLKYGVLRHLE